MFWNMSLPGRRQSWGVSRAHLRGSLVTTGAVHSPLGLQSPVPGRTQQPSPEALLSPADPSAPALTPGRAASMSTGLRDRHTPRPAHPCALPRPDPCPWAVLLAVIPL